MFLGKSLRYGQPWLERRLGQYGVRLGMFGVTTLSCEASMGRSDDSLMPSGHGDPVSFSFAGLQYAELLISGQSLGILSGMGENGPHLHTVCHILEVLGGGRLLPYSCSGVKGWTAGKALALGPSSLLGNLFSGPKPPPPWPRSHTLSFCDPMGSQIKLVPIGNPWLPALSHFLAAHPERACQPLPS